MSAAPHGEAVDAPVLEVCDLEIRFRTDEGPVHAVTGLSFTVGRGEVLAVVGESGCGKSVTALSILGLQPTNAQVRGRIMFEGEDLLSIPARKMRDVRGGRIGMVFQEPMSSLNPVMSVGRQIKESLRRHRGLSGRAATERAVELLELVRIPAARQRLDDYPHQMSGGMRQRVMLAIAMACDPAVLLADEPTTALDVTIQAQVLDILRDLRADLGTAVVLITHDLGVVADIADRVLVMYAGHQVEAASLDDLFASPLHPYTAGLMNAVPRRQRHNPDGRLAEIKGIVPVLRREPEACVFAPRCPSRTPECDAEMPALRPAADGTAASSHPVACVHPGSVEVRR
jgi:peptide/nickel transport system ATP-binding protein